MSTVITFGSLKGGVGKTSLAILLANCLGKAGKKVLVIDMDFNNSMSSVYLTEQTAEEIINKNIAEALKHCERNLNDFVVKTEREGVDLIASSLQLIDLRALSEKRLSQQIESVENYDFVIIDSPPTYDNIVLNAYYASDYIITPVGLSMFDLNTAKFLKDKMQKEIEKIDNWFLHINGFNHRFEEAKGGNQKDYLTLFTNTFDNFTPVKSWTPWTSHVREVTDRLVYLSSEKGNAKAIVDEKLYDSVRELASCFIDEEEGETLLETPFF